VTTKLEQFNKVASLFGNVFLTLSRVPTSGLEELAKTAADMADTSIDFEFNDGIFVGSLGFNQYSEGPKGNTQPEINKDPIEKQAGTKLADEFSIGEPVDVVEYEPKKGFSTLDDLYHHFQSFLEGGRQYA
jgi:hypothetical protein